jgi:hypothetical protein
VDPLNIYFTNYQIGKSPPAPRAISVTSQNPANGLNLSITLPDTCRWLTLSATSGITPWELKAIVNADGLRPDNYTCTFLLRGKRASAPAKVAAYLTVTQPSEPSRPPPRQPPTLSISISSLPFGTYQLGGAAPAPKDISVTSSNPASGLSFAATLGSACNWLHLSATSGTTSARVTASVNTPGLLVGSYSCVIAFAAAGAGASNPSLLATLNVVAPPLPIPKIVDCNAPDFNAPRRGTFTWFGATLEPNAELVIGGPDERLGGGRIIRQRFPGCDVDVTIITPPSGVKIEDYPSPKDGFRRVKLRNTSTEPLSSIEVHWQAK